MEIEKKIWPRFFEKVLSGEKQFEVRLDDFACSAGDTLVLREWDPESKSYTGRILKKSVKYVSKTKNLDMWSKEEIEQKGLQIIGF